MIARDLVTDSILPLKASDTGLLALHWFDEFRVTHLPVVSDSQLIGLISEDDVFAADSFEEPIWSYQLKLQNISVKFSEHIYEVMRLFSVYKLTLLPVTDEKELYMGVITLEKLVEKVTDTAAINDPGGILVLELNASDYSMVEITRIIEENDTRILSLYISSTSGSNRLELTMKLNRIDIQPVIEALIRNGFTVSASFFESEYFDGLRERYDSLMNYLNI